MGDIASHDLGHANAEHDDVVTGVADLSPSVVHRVISVKILRQFRRSFDFEPEIEVILVDIKGDKIHATIDEDYIGMWSSVSAEGSWIQVTDFNLIRVVGTFRPTPHEYKIHCNVRTRFKNIPSCGGGDFFSSVPFRDILEGLINRIYCVDVIARIVAVKNFPYEHVKEKERKPIFLLLEDEEGLRLKCRLVGDYYRDFVTAIRGLALRPDNKIGILTIQFGKIEKHKGKLWVVPTRNCTVIGVNRPCVEVSRLWNVFDNRNTEVGVWRS